MKDKLLKRLQELSAEMEEHITHRESYAKAIRNMDARIKELAVLIPELQKLLDSEKED